MLYLNDFRLESGFCHGLLENLNFDNSVVRELPGDPESGLNRRQVLGACFSPVAATRVSRPWLVACAAEVAD